MTMISSVNPFLPPRGRRSSSPSLGRPLPKGFAYYNGRTAWAPTDDGEDVIAFVGGRELLIGREEAFQRFGCDCLAGQTPASEPRRGPEAKDRLHFVRGAGAPAGCHAGHE